MSHGKLFDIVAPNSKFYKGPFGRICANLDGWKPQGVSDTDLDDFLIDIANDEMTELPGAKPGEIAADQSIIDQLEADFGSNIPAAYTYFGQFIDHDITFDPASMLMRQSDPNRLQNFRTPRLDLDNVYGPGQADAPYLYDNNDKSKLLIGNIEGTNMPDLPRNSQGRALIGDMRNDENSMVSQLQLAFLLAHNTLVDRARDQGHAAPFKSAQRSLRWLYQHCVWHDFVTRIANNEIQACALKSESVCGPHTTWKLGLKDVYSWHNTPYMPVEFSVAAYRFGHSMVRNSYQTNDPHRGFKSFAPIFDNSTVPPVPNPDGLPDDLRGFRPMKLKNVLQWDWFLEMQSSGAPFFPQRARKIDTKLCNALAALHEDAVGSPMNILAYRNLRRGIDFNLPSGVDVAKKYCLPVTNIDSNREFLWYYILKEAENLPGANKGQMLGRLGSTIVCATIAGLLKGDPNSYFNIEPCWTPNDDPLLDAATDRIDSDDWTLASIIRLSGLPVDASDFSKFA